jgi:hypothetical protein
MMSQSMSVVPDDERATATQVENVVKKRKQKEGKKTRKIKPLES